MLLLQYGSTPLRHAVERGHSEVVKLLLSKGANVSYIIMYDNLIFCKKVKPGLDLYTSV